MGFKNHRVFKKYKMTQKATSAYQDFLFLITIHSSPKIHQLGSPIYFQRREISVIRNLSVDRKEYGKLLIQTD